MNLSPRWIAVVAAMLIGSPGGAQNVQPALEKWADTKLPITTGLELWLDASRANGSQLVPHDGKLETWFDASGKKRHLHQPVSEARPTRLPLGESAVVRFDGVDDHLRAMKQAASLETFTIFVAGIPRNNLGGFRAVMAFNEPQKRDFESGLTLDFGPFATPRFSVFNAEGKGFGTWRNLMTRESPMGQFRTLRVRGEGKSVRVAVDGQDAGNRPRDGSRISMEEITVGARYYTLGGGAQQVQGFGSWDVAEILVFNRLLSPEETSKVEDYLNRKHAAIRQQPPPGGDGPVAMLVPVKDPPAVQMFLPGFTVREIPVDLTNINNVMYRPDGTLLALAYDGVIWKLRDTDGDGLEDKAEVFWDSKGTLRSPIGMDITPPGYHHGEGVFVAAKAQCALLVDTDKDGKADKEIIVAGGFKESFHQVDGLGVAFDRRDGSVYLGRGTANFADPMLKDKEGKPHYDLKGEAGTILRVAPDFKSREIVATGIRFPVGLHFNRHGDLFATDQEGATWVPNGNPLDELLHIQKGRHYGFPPRNPKWLPQVIDEPSTFDYGPQHQSTCGFAFNEPINEGGPTFGPREWVSDALVTGESRGKLYRTQLVKTGAGYVGRTQLLGCLKMLTIDCCVAPDGSLVVACHSGGPDWGSGPTGKGKLFKITYSDKNHPQPVFVWPSGPREIRVEFDRPVDPSFLKNALRLSKLTGGRHVRAGDRFESIWPGYAIVQLQKMAPRFDLSIRSAQLTPNGRTLVLATDGHQAAVQYGLTLPGMGRPTQKETPRGVLPQVPEIDLDFDLSGCEAVWKPANGDPSWSGWLPHLDLQVAKAMTAGSSHHQALWQAMTQAGELTLRVKLDLFDMLRPAIQPGSQLDYELLAEQVKLTFETPGRVMVTSESGISTAGQTVTLNHQPRKGSPLPLKVQVAFSGGNPTLAVSYTTKEDARVRSIPLWRIMVPWADRESRSIGEAAAVRVPELEGGSWARGRAVFFGDGNCSKCHLHHGAGSDVGPDLSNLVHRDYASVLRDITSPSFAINPDHLTYLVEMVDGRTFTGVIRTMGDTVHIGDAKGVITKVDRKAIERMTASPISTMPEDLLKQLGPDRSRDLLTYLLTAAPRMPEYGPGTPPPARSRNELAAVLKDAPSPPLPTRPITVVLVAGRKDHGPGEHDYPAWQKAWKELMAIAEKTTVETAYDWPSSDQFQKADVLVFYQQGKWTKDRAKDMDAFLERGGGAVYIHYAVDGGSDAPGFAQRIGLAWQGGKSMFRHGPLDLGFETGVRHPIGRNFAKVHFHDESYWQLVGDPKRITLLAHGKEAGKDQPLFWTLEPAKGRVVVSIPGHFAWTFDDPLFRVLLLRGIAWAGREPVDRFNDLVTPGARLKE